MRGFWFMIEAVVAGIILVSFLYFISTERIAFPEEDAGTLAYRTLEGLNRQGTLRSAAEEGNATKIDGEVSIYAFGHAVQLCQYDSCTGQVPSASNIWTGSYVTAGNSRYNPREVRLHIYR